MLILELCPIHVLERICYLCNVMLARESKTQVAGVVWVIDCKGFGKKQMKSWDLDNLKKTATYQVRLIVTPNQ